MKSHRPVATGGRRALGALLAVVTLIGLACRGSGDLPTPADAPVERVAVPLTALSRSGWVATASATGGTNVAANAIDASTSTRWSTGVNQANGQFFQVDLGSPQTFVELSLHTTPFPTDFPRAFQVSVSNDGTNFGTPIATGTGTAALVTIGFPPQTAKFVRVTLTGAATAPWSVANFNVFTTTLSRTGWIATATSTNGGNASNALDGVATTNWTSLSAQTNQSFQVNMVARQSFNQVTLDSGSSTSNFPRSYSVFVSNDGTNFGGAVATGTATASPVVINLPAQFAQFIKITAGTNAAPWTIAELTINGQPTVQTTLPRSGWTAVATSTSSTTTTAGALDGNTGTRWSSAGAQTSQSFTVDMKALRTFNQITLDAGTTSNDFPRAYSLFVSNDGVNFGSAVGSGSGSAALVVINPPTQTARYLKINQNATNAAPWSIQELNVIGPTVVQGGWNATASSTGGTDLPVNAVDGVATTRWSSAAAQTNGQTFQVDLGVAQTFNQLTLDAGTSTGDYPRGYSVAVSSDGTTFGAPIATGVGSTQVVTINFTTTTARAIRITQTGTATNVWSIHELNVSRIAQPCDTATCTASDMCHTAGTCDPNTGMCSNPARPDGQACDDGSSCTINDTCIGGVCQGGFGTTCAAGPNVTFYQSYNNGTTVDFAAGSPFARVPNPLIPAPGVYGPGIDSTTAIELSYATNSNMSPTSFVTSKPGSFSMWIKPSAQFSSFFTRLFDNNANTKLDVTASATVVTAEFDYGPGTYVFATAPWTPDSRWHLIVVNWSRLAAEVSVDGAAPVPSTFGGGPSFAFGPNPGNLIYAGGNDGPGYSKDEFLVLNRPLTNAEIQSYYQQGKAGGFPAPNPLIAQLNASGIACNAFDDLNPCTADSCNPTTGGPTSVPVANGTPCSDANMCNGAETCQAGACLPGPPPGLDDGKPCTTDSCSPAGGVAHTPITDGSLCVAGTPTVVPRLDGIVDVGGGKRVAVFGYDSAATSNVVIMPGTSNAFTSNGGPVPNPVPAPPTTFLPQKHPGTFLPTFAATDTLRWTLAGTTLPASGSLTPLPHVLIGSSGAFGVNVTDPVTGQQTLVQIQADLTPWRSAVDPVVATDEPGVGSQFNGTIPASLSVGPTGAASYTVPIKLPPAIGGMAPNLSLLYNSQAPDGIAGQGWSLTGLSVIHRCAKTRAIDGVAQAVKMDSAVPITSPDGDGVCIDGKRLLVSGQDGPETLFAPEATDFSRISFSNNTFRVVTKSGEVRSYGLRPESRVNFLVTMTAAWPLDRVSDQWGNYYDLYYNDPSRFAADGLLVMHIDYTLHAAGTLAPSGTPFGPEPKFETIWFVYQPRDDIRNMRFASYTVPFKSRLNSIVTSLGTYQLTYEPPNAFHTPSILNSISYCLPGSSICAKSLDFGWSSSPYGWVEQSSFASPRGLGKGTGTQFVDLDGDGRADFVQGTTAWRNTGTGWERQDTTNPNFHDAPWTLPVALVDADQKPTAMFADLDGDGLLDLVGANGTFWLNAIYRRGGWKHLRPERAPATLDFAGGGHAMMDVDGDSRADLVIVGAGSIGTQLNSGVIVNDTGQINFSAFVDMIFGPNVQKVVKPGFHFEDINRDGFPDIVGPAIDEHGVRLTSIPSYLNRGNDFVFTTIAAASYAGTAVSRPRGDVDGDGVYDQVTVANANAGGNFNGCTPTSGIQVEFGDGNGFTTAGNAGYMAGLAALCHSGFMMPTNMLKISSPDLNADGLADIVWNHPSEGIPNSAGGQFLVNTGATWVDYLGTAPTWMGPTGPGQVPFKDPLYCPSGATCSSVGTDDSYAYVDLNGDGVTDLVQASSFGQPASSTPPYSKAWLNATRPPIITRFPNGIAAQTVVDYVTLTAPEARTSGVYTDTWAMAPANGLTPKLKALMAPLRVVSAVSSADGLTNTLLTTTYRYQDLRSDLLRGPQGFLKTVVTEPSGLTTTTVYRQDFPYSGLPDSVTKENQGLVATTEMGYCGKISGVGDNCGGFDATNNFIHLHSQTDGTYYRSQFPEVLPALFAEPNPNLVMVNTDYFYDDHGNLVRLAAATKDADGAYSKSVVNTYGAPGSEEERRGKVTKSIVTNARLATATVPASSTVHTTEFEYQTVAFVDDWVAANGGHQPVALVKEKVEPQGPDALRLYTAFAYDRFGNLTTTTACASDVDNCAPGVAGPATLPYRTTTVSYEPIDYVLPPGANLAVTTLSYGPGRFPVKTTKTTSAANYTEYTAYDPRFGTVTQQTAPNGISSCRLYDGLGHLMGNSERCGSPASLLTLMQVFNVPPADAGPTRSLVTVTVHPGGKPSWLFTDSLGRTVESVEKGFDGRLVSASTEYDRLGRTFRTSRPGPRSEFKYWTTVTEYDPLNRPRTVVTDLAQIDASGVAATERKTTTYQGKAILTQTFRRDGSLAEKQTETKNALGKTATLKDTADSPLTYTYDGDGNLTDTTDGFSHNVHLEYDKRGRKTAMNDPDHGPSSYTYDAFGELITQTDAKNVVVTTSYDGLGRMVEKRDGSGLVLGKWVYYTAPGAGLGKLAASIGPPDAHLGPSCAVPLPNVTIPGGGSRVTRWFSYTSLGELQDSSQCTDGQTFVTSYAYDSLGRQRTVTYPEVAGSRFAVQYNYSSLGDLYSVSEPGPSGAVYWAATSVNALGQVTGEYTRNGVVTSSTRNPATGWLMASTSLAKADGMRRIQDWSYQYEEIGNLHSRTRTDEVNPANSDETFGYDALNRLNSARMRLTTGPTPYDVTEQYHFNEIGNMDLKAGKSYSYTGCGAGPHAVCSVDGGPGFQYDQNGNLTTGNGRTIGYDFANRVKHIVSSPSPSLGNDQGTVDFVYDADGNRAVQAATGPDNVAARTTYVGMGATGKTSYERTMHGPEIQDVYYLYAGGAHGGNAFAMRVVTSSAATSVAMKYNHFDHLGSVTATSDDLGRVASAEWSQKDATLSSYDAWGARRNPNGTAASPASFNLQPGHREFTGHETIPGVGLVNMNGRVYDPVLGRFLTPDPTIQLSANLQSYNRYGYALGNPLRYTDPSGYSISFESAFFTTWTVAIAVGTAVACTVATDGACGVVLVMGALMVASAQAAQGASAGQIALTTGVSLAAGWAGGALAGAIVGPNAGIAAQMLGGALASATSSIITTEIVGGQLSAGNILLAAAQGALTAGVAYAAHSGAPLSKSDVAEASGGVSAQTTGGKRVETIEALLAEAGNTGLDPVDAALFDAGYLGGTGEADVLALARPRELHYDVVVGVARGPNGELLDYKISWRLSQPSNQGGWIVQNVTTRSTVPDANFAPGPGYWEAWRVPAGSTRTNYFPSFDDQFQFPGGAPGSHGSTTETGVARFYDGVSLPRSFVGGNVDPAGDLRSTWSSPHLPTGSATAPVIRSISATW